MARGDHIYCSRGIYSHHGIDCGDGTVIHYWGEKSEKRNAEVRRTPLADFANGDEVKVVEYGKRDAPDIVISRAEMRLGEKRYSILETNCEHFARSCMTGEERSEQVRNGVGTAGAASVAGLGATAGLGVVSIGGSVAGLSGAGVMSGLAAAGGTAVGGIAVLGAAPGVAGALILNSTVFADDESAPQEVRGARKAARVATCTGTVAGTAGAIGAVSAMGTAGLSGVGITTGLSAIGATIGGGMVAGTAVVIAAPLAVAAVAGGIVYGLVRLFR